MDEYDYESAEFDEAVDYDEDDTDEEEMEFDEAVSMLAESDDDDDDDDEEEFAEFLPLVGIGAGAVAARALSRRMKKVRRAKPRRSYARRARGKRYGIIRTPAGRARVKLPGRFPTIPEFRRTVGEIQKDIKKNSAGIKDLVAAQKRLAALAGRSDKGLEKRVFGLQIGVIALAALSLPQVKDLIRSITS